MTCIRENTSTSVKIEPQGFLMIISTLEVIDQKQVQVFHQGFQTPRKRLKHDAEGGVLLFNCFEVFGTPDEK